MSRNWTSDQYDAICARKGTVLVSAAAGSGKTAVLVQRVIERLTDSVNPTDADRLLVVTFTKAAAAEMRERIAERLKELLEHDPQNRHLQRQLLLFARAQISTIDSFCYELVQEHFYKLGLSPDLRILDDSELALLRHTAMTSVLERNYQEPDTSFIDLIETFGSDRDDNAIMEKIEALYQFTRSNPFPQKWLEQTAALYDGNLPLGQTLWGQIILKHGQRMLDYGICLLKRALDCMREDAVLFEKYEGLFSEDIVQLTQARAILESGAWDLAAKAAVEVNFKRRAAIKGYKEDALYQRVCDYRDRAKEMVKKLKPLFFVSEQQAKEDFERLNPLVRKLFALTMEFDRELMRLKAERKAAEFSDLEHWALELLVQETPQGFVRTPEALTLSERFDEVMVDEYQDTNRVQDMLFCAVSRNEENLFMVGDIKQSIYGFRQAQPQIFLQRRHCFSLYDRDTDVYPAYIVLDKNFRSRKTVTDAVNFVFSQIMSEQAGGVAYEGKELLAPMAQFPENDRCQTELHVIDLGAEFEREEQDEEEAAAIPEAVYIAERIAEMIAEPFLVTENGEQRPVKYSDFCILLRSANKLAPDYAKALEERGIPAWVDARGGFFATAEVAVALSFLRVIDNPLQDIALAGVLMSPIYGFTVDEMAQLRMQRLGQPLYLACRAFAEQNAQAKAFLGDLEQYRTLAATMPVDCLLDLLYRKSGYLHMVQTMTHGETRLSNLQRLMEYARQFETAGYHGLSGFVRYIDRLQKKKTDLSAACVTAETADAVKIMSIHRSKGLEFPICILARCGGKFNLQKDNTLLHPDLGLGVKLKDKRTNCRYNTVVREAIALEFDREQRSEEMRVLYVAMTRAKEKLILLTAEKKLDAKLTNLAAHLGGRPKQSSFAVNCAAGFSDWILACALRHPNGIALRRRAMADESIVLHENTLPWKICITPPKAAFVQKQQSVQPQTAPVDEKLLDVLRREMNFTYDRVQLTRLPAKVTASELAGKTADVPSTLARPRFMSSFGLTPAERGTALHQFMQFADYHAACKDPQSECKRLAKQGYLTQRQLQAIDLQRVKAFFESHLGRRMVNAVNLEKEKRFMVEVPLGVIQEDLPKEIVRENAVLQGAVDCVFEEDGKLVVVDFKTDRGVQPEQLWQRYCTQLALYAYAMEQTYRKSVKECLLYSFDLKRQVSGELQRKIDT